MSTELRDYRNRAESVIGKAFKALDVPGAFVGCSEIAAALDSAGLLVTPLHERALKACEGLHDVDGRENKTIGAAYGFQASLNEARSVGFESLAAKAAAKKAKEPAVWGYHEGIGPAWWVENTHESHAQQTGPFTEPQARAVAAALNALDK